jgi:hypothetical protein
VRLFTAFFRLCGLGGGGELATPAMRAISALSSLNLLKLLQFLLLVANGASSWRPAGCAVVPLRLAFSCLGAGHPSQPHQFVLVRSLIACNCTYGRAALDQALLRARWMWVVVNRARSGLGLGVEHDGHRVLLARLYSAASRRLTRCRVSAT